MRYIEIEYYVPNEYITDSGLVLDTNWNASMYYPREATCLSSGCEEVKVGDKLYVVRLSSEQARLEGRLTEGGGVFRAFVRLDDIILAGKDGVWRGIGDYLVVEPLLNEDRSMFKVIGGVELLLGKEPPKYVENEVVVRYSNGEYGVGDRLVVVSLSKLRMETEFVRRFGEDLFRVYKSQVCMVNGELVNERVLVRPLGDWNKEKGEMRGVVVKSALRDLVEGDEIVYTKMCETEVTIEGEKLIVTEENFIFFKINH